jgi:hypothetical protein
MKLLRPLVTVTILAILAAAGWFWWNLPTKVDLTEYAPADSIVYIEINSVPRIAEALQTGESWKAVATAVNAKPTSSGTIVKTALRAGIGPASAVMFSRSQIALIVLSVNSIEEGESVTKKPEFALVAETHTSSWRTRPVAQEAIQKLASMIFRTANCVERPGNVEIFECVGATPERKVVAGFEGSVIVIGNTERAVQSCLEVRRGSRPSLKTSAELQQARASMSSDDALAFGYVSRGNSPKLFAWAAPLVLGSEVNDGSLQKLLENSVSKLIGSIAWTAKSTAGSIEDRFVFSVDPDVVSQLQPAFVTTGSAPDIGQYVPRSVQSVSFYRSQKPLTAWDSLNTAIALKLDTVQSVVMGTVLRSGLNAYGIDNPREFLASVDQPLLTLKPSPTAEGSVLVVHVSDKERLKRSLLIESFKPGTGQIIDGVENQLNREVEFAAVFRGEHLVMGKTENVIPYLAALREAPLTSESKLTSGISASTGSAAIVTSALDDERVNSFVRTLLAFENKQLSSDEQKRLEGVLGNQFSHTQTFLNESGIERRTMSAFGQFSTITSIFSPNTASAPK